MLVLPGIAGLSWLLARQLGSVTHVTRPYSIFERLLTEPRVFLDYIAWSVAPNPHALSLYHDDYAISHGLMYPPSTLLAIIAVLSLVAAAIWQRGRRPLVSLGILWFFAGQLLTGTIVNLEIVYEHRNYLPSLGLLLVLFGFIVLEPSKKFGPRKRAISAFALVAVYGAVTAICVKQWSDPLLYAAISAKEHPNSPRATYALGETYGRLVDSPDPDFSHWRTKHWKRQRKFLAQASCPNMH